MGLRSIGRRALGFALAVNIMGCARSVEPPIHDGGTIETGAGDARTIDAATDATFAWEWVQPLPEGNDLRAIGGTSENDLWLVGGAGTILHWNGVRTEVAFRGDARDVFYSVAAIAPDDVWIGGRAAGGNVKHWDGRAWSSDYSIGSEPIHALFAMQPRSVYAITGDGTRGQLHHWDGRSWGNAGFRERFPVLRALFGTFEGEHARHLWAVGQRGTIVHFGSNRPETLKPAEPDSGVVDDPASTDKDYVAVWGTSHEDVWALFTTGTSLGFSHFDGTTWRVTQRFSPLCGAFNDLSSSPLMRGTAIVGIDAEHAIATACNTYVLEGDRWVTPTSSPGWDAADSKAYAGAVAVPEGVFAVGDSGLFAQHERTNGELFEYVLDPSSDVTFSAVARSGNRTWALVSSWTGGDVHEWVDGARRIFDLSTPYDIYNLADIAAIAPDDVFIAGTVIPYFDGPLQAALWHWDGTAWSEPRRMTSIDEISGIWAAGPRDIWIVGTGGPYDWTLGTAHVYHGDGTTWTRVPIPVNEVGSGRPEVWGLRSDAVWFSVNVVGSKPSEGHVLFWDGHAVREIHREVGLWYARGATKPFATSTNDIWIPSWPTRHFDGTRWESMPTGELAIAEMTGAPNDVWAVGEGPAGGAIWHWNGLTFERVLDTTAHLYGIRGGPGLLPWAVGSGGATLELRERR